MRTDRATDSGMCRGRIGPTGWMILLTLMWSGVCLFPGSPTSGLAQVGGGVNISPPRVIFEGRNRSTTVTLRNSSQSPVTYRIYFINMRMNANGRLELVEKEMPNEKFAESLVRYSPREITVPALSNQTVRLMVRKPKNLPEGEYRSHLVFKALPPEDTSDIEAQVTEQKGVKVRLVTVLSLSIPVIVRHGNLSVSASLADLTFEPAAGKEKDRLVFSLKREGEKSLYGEVQVFFQPAKGDKIQVGRARGVALYSPNQFRWVRVPLTPPEGLNLEHGTLQVVYRDGIKNKNNVFSEAELALP